MLKFNDDNNLNDINIADYYEKYQDIIKRIENKSAQGSDFLGWIDLLNNYDYKMNEQIKNDASRLRKYAKTMVVIGVGGSYLGYKAISYALKNQLLPNEYNLIYVGNNLSDNYINEVIEYCKENDFVVNVISKSGTTLETIVSFQLIYDVLVDKYGLEAAKERIVITTDAHKGDLRKLAIEQDICSYEIVDDIGGRYSVFTSVGLLPLAFINCDIDQLIKGAINASKEAYTSNKNDAFLYAANRVEQFKKNKLVEAFVIYEPKMKYVLKWIEQLFGESEGKDDKGLLPISFIYTTDLHSLGQFIQDGNKILFETTINIKQPNVNPIIIGNSTNNSLIASLKEKNIFEMNQKVLNAVTTAHVKEGHVPNLLIELERLDEYNLGYLLSFMMYSCMYSAYFMGVNPFDQPGVEVYKKEIKKIL